MLSVARCSNSETTMKPSSLSSSSRIGLLDLHCVATLERSAIIFLVCPKTTPKGNHWLSITMRSSVWRKRRTVIHVRRCPIDCRTVTYENTNLENKIRLLGSQTSESAAAGVLGDGRQHR